MAQLAKTICTSVPYSFYERSGGGGGRLVSVICGVSNPLPCGFQPETRLGIHSKLYERGGKAFKLYHEPEAILFTKTIIFKMEL
jgi:hypothetical protein